MRRRNKPRQFPSFILSLAFVAGSLVVSPPAHCNEREVAASDHLHVSVTPYLWLLGISGTFSVAGLSIPALFESNRPLASFDGWSWNARALAGFRYASLSVDGGLSFGPVANVSDSWFDPLFGVLWLASSDTGWRGEARRGPDPDRRSWRGD